LGPRDFGAHRQHLQRPGACCISASGAVGGGGALRPRPREVQFPALWAERARRLCAFIRDPRGGLGTSHVICLQEYTFEPGWQKIFHEMLGADYHFYGAQRPKKQDGCLTLLRKG
ncbi:unnamed protein product, partial [Heterosigma akashiwo]